MPPKKPQPTSSKKAEQKKKEKVIEDKTFGLKNKKGTKQQKFIAQVEKQVKSGGQHPVNALNPNAKKEEKERKLKEQKEMQMIFKPVQTQKIEKGTDPKSVVCVFFKQGQCSKGDKCKFSHDLSVERKVEKRSLYVDMRDDGTEADSMENWNDEKLKEVVDKKHGKEKRMPTTDIICKYFLDAVEKYKYGWFWECPNGEKCIYRHALPQGYVLKRDKKILDQKKPEISLVDLIESERAALGPNQTRVTLESFIAWKKRKIEEKKEKIRRDEEKKRNEFKSGKNIGLSGREMFSFNPELVNDGQMEDGDEAFDSYERDEEESETGIEYHEIDFTSITLGEVDGTGTVATEDRFHRPQGENEDEDEEEASDDTPTEGAEGMEASDAAPINENLFLSEDLEGLDDELNELDIDK
ncbi:zinc finger CCCH domain-containing protein 15 homolog [Phlebotomus argentipes]|uniref:zinc finger CCCH domain-containing protein 15 homolog n=1 Tax=Phlebotomus argentipes TaxID=94469 RepID=UPI00289297CB|nr:zinc finger CCCH domain-containing protein 15 homolog [Phlebotomus argentipes]